MSEQARRLRQLFAEPGVIRLMGSHNALGARLVERAGFEGVWSSGLEISTSHAVPDANILTQSDYLRAAESMAESVNIPVVADVDTGYGNSNNVIHMVRKFEAADVAAVCIEDKLFPKVNSFIPGRQELAPLAEFVGKIMAAKNAQRTPEFMVFARMESLIAGWGQAEALKRADASLKAGADAILIHSKATTVDQIAEFVRAWENRCPLIVVPTTYPHTTIDEFEELGVKVVIYANQGMRAAITAMEKTYQEIIEGGCTGVVDDKIVSMKTVFELQDMPQMKADEAAYLRSGDYATKGVILSAGDHMSAHSMKDIAESTPLAMLDVNGKPLIERQVECLNLAGVREVSVVTGYRAESVEADGAKLVRNENWKDSGEVTSLRMALEGDEERVLVIYGDTLFDGDAVSKILKSDADVTLLVDRTYDAARGTSDRRILDLVKLESPRSNDRRYLEPDALSRVARISREISDADGEFTGVVLLTAAGLTRLNAICEAAGDKPIQEASSLEKASITDVIQEMIDRGEEVACVEVSSGWLEIHSFDDYQAACRMVAR